MDGFCKKKPRFRCRFRIP